MRIKAKLIEIGTDSRIPVPPVETITIKLEVKGVEEVRQLAKHLYEEVHIECEPKTT